MIIGLPAYTLLHVLLSLGGIVSGLIVVGGLMAGRLYDRWIGVFLVTTLLTNATGFGFPFTRLLPSHILGGLALVILPFTFYAFYGKKLEGGWKRVFVITSVTVLYFNVFVLLAQLFAKVPGLIAVAPTQQSPAFGLTQLLALVTFIILGRAASQGFLKGVA